MHPTEDDADDCFQIGDDANSDRESIGSLEPARKRLRAASSSSSSDDRLNTTDDVDESDVIPFGDSDYEPIEDGTMSDDDISQPSDVEYKNHRGLSVVNRLVIVESNRRRQSFSFSAASSRSA